MKNNIIEPLKDLNDIRRTNKLGIYKQWIYKDKCYMKMCDYMQKINYSIQDLNSTLLTINNFENKNIVFLIVLVDWIKESVSKILTSIRPEVIKNFQFSSDRELNEYDSYFTAMRSFVIAHPLSTNRHETFGFDGNYICIDIRANWRFIGFSGDNFYFSLDKKGLKDGLNKSSDFYLFCYSDKDDNMKFFRIIGCKYFDIIETARLYIAKIYELDNYLCKQKKALFQI